MAGDIWSLDVCVCVHRAQSSWSLVACECMPELEADAYLMAGV